MIGLGALMNTAAIALAGVTGHFIGRAFDENRQSALIMACGVSTLFIGIAGAMQGMLSIAGDGLTSGRAMFVVACLTLGGLMLQMAGVTETAEAGEARMRQAIADG